MKRLLPGPSLLGLSAAAALAALACRGGGPPAPVAAPAAPPGVGAAEVPEGDAPLADPRAWRAQHAGAAQAFQRGGPGEGCRISVRSGKTVLWSVSACVGHQGDPAFVSADGARLLVLEPLPDHRGPDWSDATVLTLLERGQVVRRVTGRELVGEVAIGDMRLSYSWIRGLGTGQDPAAAVRWSPAAGTVAFETIDGRALTVGLDGAGLPPPPDPGARRAAEQDRQARAAAEQDASDTRTYRWTDAEGSTHYTRLQAIPPTLRPRAVPVGEAE